jgi:soluble lytic murein transglycosylase-like protein
MGLMQLMPGTAARYGVTNPYDVGQSIMGGTRYLKDLLKMFNGRVDLALAGYNAGEGAVMKYGNSIPPYVETRNYVKLILKRYTKKPTS